ncbi:MAG: xanthine dehydrogenase family protein molybdopterin-binding subunit, partial [Pseudomonadota bacterium]
MTEMVRIGADVERVEDTRFLTGTGTYIDDLALPNQAEAVVFRAPVAHARITNLDVEAARAADGVLLVITGEEWVGFGYGPVPTKTVVRKFRDGSPFNEPTRHCLAHGAVHHAGEAVAFVVAETKQQALDAVELIEFDFEDLESVVDQRAARAETAPTLWDAAPGNV